MNSIENIECGLTGNTLNVNELKPEKDTIKISGIYKIINKIDGKYYVGSSYDVKKRWRSHVNDLRRRIHPNIYLQRAWNKFGENSFEFILLKSCELKELEIYEQIELNLCSDNPTRHYNISTSSSSPMRGRRHSEETKQKMKIAHSGKIRTDEHCKNLSLSLKGKYVGIKHSGFNIPLKDCHKRKISISTSGKIKSVEARKKMSKSKSGANHPRYNHKTYRFFNKKLNISVDCTKHQLESTYNLIKSNVSRIISGERKSHRGWIINPTP